MAPSFPIFRANFETGRKTIFGLKLQCGSNWNWKQAELFNKLGIKQIVNNHTQEIKQLKYQAGSLFKYTEGSAGFP